MLSRLWDLLTAPLFNEDICHSSYMVVVYVGIYHDTEKHVHVQLFSTTMLLISFSGLMVTSTVLFIHQ